MFALFESIRNERWAQPCLSSCVFLLNLLFHWIRSNSEWANLECTHNVRTQTPAQLKWWHWNNKKRKLRRESCREKKKRPAKTGNLSKRANFLGYQHISNVIFHLVFVSNPFFSRLFLLRFVLLLLLLAVHPFEIKWTHHALRRIHTSHSASQDHLLSIWIRRRRKGIVYNGLCYVLFRTYSHWDCLLWLPSNHINTIHIHFNCIAAVVMGIRCMCVCAGMNTFAVEKALCVMPPHTHTYSHQLCAAHTRFYPQLKSSKRSCQILLHFAIYMKLAYVFLFRLLRQMQIDVEFQL